MAHILSAGKIMSIIPPGGKLNPRYVCSWRSYDRHWMPNAWFWHTLQLMTFAVPVCFGFFLAFCNVFCIHELAKSASFFVCFFNFSGFSTLLRAIFFIAKDAEHLSSRLDSLIQDFGSLLKETACKLLDEDVTRYQERLTSYWTKMLQRIRNVLQVTGQRCYNVSGPSYRLLDEDVTTCQEIVIDNAGHRTLLHPPNPPQNPAENQPKKRQYTKVTTVLPPNGRRHQKHAMRSKEQTVNEPISFS